MPQTGCQFAWLRTGDEAFAAMLEAIRAAEHSIRLEAYIFAPSKLGEQFRDALAQASQRGVDVRVLVDALGSMNLTASFWVPFLEAGGEFRWFNPLNLKRLTFRDHRKLLVCDDRVAFVGGFNIAPEYEGDGVQRGWRDVGLRLCGDLADELAGSFDALFERADLEHRPFTRLRRAAARQTIRGEYGQALLSGPGRGRNAIKRALTSDLRGARLVQIVAAYFLPTGRLRRALCRVARRGGKVQIIVPARSDVPLSQLAGQSLYQRLLRAGVEILEYQPQVLHTKLILVDGVCYVGSANLDARSLHINYELMVRLTDAPLVAEARSVFLDHARHGERVDPKRWRDSRSFWRKLKERWACFVLARLDLLLMRRQLRRLKR